MRRRARVLALLLAVALPAVTCLVAGAGSGGRSAAVDERAGVSAMTAIQGPLTVLPARTSVDDREVGTTLDPWRILALCVVAALFVAACAVVRRSTPMHPVRRRDAHRRWVRFRAPPRATVPALHA